VLISRSLAQSTAATIRAARKIVCTGER
jgi:hypothetical protein